MGRREELKQMVLMKKPLDEETRKKLTIVLEGGYWDLLERLCLVEDQSKTNLVRIALDFYADKVGRERLYPIHG
jgi:hypothetical protein